MAHATAALFATCSLTKNYRRSSHEWLLFWLRRGVLTSANAETSTLRAHAAQKMNSRCGLKTAVRGALYKSQPCGQSAISLRLRLGPLLTDCRCYLLAMGLTLKARHKLVEFFTLNSNMVPERFCRITHISICQETQDLRVLTHGLL